MKTDKQTLFSFMPNRVCIFCVLLRYIDGINIPAESFHWNVGKMIEDKLILSYYVKLDGSDDYSAENGIYPTNEYASLTYTDAEGRHTEVLSVPEGRTANDVLMELIGKGLSINSFKELMPRMNDIFIKLVTEG